MTRMLSYRTLRGALLCLLASMGGMANGAEKPAASICYTINLADQQRRLIHVQIELGPGASRRDLQLPVWNALYQVRDFSQYVRWIHARGKSGEQLPVRMLNKSLWQVQGASRGAIVEYEMLADVRGPFGAQFNSEHAFFNFAEILMYAVDARSRPVIVTLANIPTGWKLASTLPLSDMRTISAANYDQLVDSPVEIGNFEETAFDEAGAHYRIVVHRDSKSGNSQIARIADTLRRIVKAEIAWMDDQPLDHYLFIYHFPSHRGGGGMEHAFGTAIELKAGEANELPESLASVTAHEFFHLWNVKRIRPQSLEPVDYAAGNNTRSLWFSEGVTSTVEQFVLLTSGLIDDKKFLESLSQEITTLQNRPSHLTQSVEDASLDAWLEKYSVYEQPERSISYYNKGFLLGVLLDLAVRRARHDQASLREVFHWMNEHYARRGLFFPESQGVRQAAESVSHSDLKSFFNKYVAGTDEIPYNEFLDWVGLKLVSKTDTYADPGFRMANQDDDDDDLDHAPRVTSIEVGSNAEAAGLAVGDAILEINGRAFKRGDLDELIAAARPGDMIRLHSLRKKQDHEVSFALSSREEHRFEVVEVEAPTADQLTHRRNWLASEISHPAGAAE